MATSRIKIAYQSILTILQSIEIGDYTLDGTTKFKYYNIWDDQIDEMILGDSYSFSTPSIFVEIQLGEAMMLGNKLTSYPNCMIIFHFCNIVLDSGDGNMEQNLSIFDIRDSVKEVTMNMNVPYCSSILPVIDQQDFKHGNMYKYVLGYKTNFIDSKGSVLDVDSGATWGYLVNPTLNLNVFKMWCSGASYTLNISVVSYRGNVYLCEVSNSDELFDKDKWLKIIGWQPDKSYLIDNYVLYTNSVLKCIEDNSDSVFDNSKWIKVTR